MIWQKTEALVKPIQDEVFGGAIQNIAEAGSLCDGFDKAGSMTMIYTNPKFDLSDQVLQKLDIKINVINLRIKLNQIDHETFLKCYNFFLLLFVGASRFGPNIEIWSH